MKTYNVSPPVCPGCGLDPKNVIEDGFEEGFLMLPIPNMGVCHFVCPRCFVVMMNKECFDTQKDIRDRADSKIITDLSDIDIRDMRAN